MQYKGVSLVGKIKRGTSSKEDMSGDSEEENIYDKPIICWKTFKDIVS